MATVSRRRGKWVADYRDGTGRRHWETYETRHAAEDALAQHVTALCNGRYVPLNNKRTVREAFESWWSLGVEGDDNRGGMPLRLSTKEIYRLTWRVHVEPVWAARKLSTIRTEEVAHWRQHLSVQARAPFQMDPRQSVRRGAKAQIQGESACLYGRGSCGPDGSRG